MTTPGFQYQFSSTKSTAEIFQLLLHPQNWWTGLYNETLEGESNAVGDVFTFSAGAGAHYSRQQLAELVPDRRIAWQVTESNLSFLKNSNEWAGTKICFDIEPVENKTLVTFTHEGLIPQIECYGACTGGWTRYLQQLAEYLK